MNERAIKFCLLPPSTNFLTKLLLSHCVFQAKLVTEEKQTDWLAGWRDQCYKTHFFSPNAVNNCSSAGCPIVFTSKNVTHRWPFEPKFDKAYISSKPWSTLVEGGKE